MLYIRVILLVLIILHPSLLFSQDSTTEEKDNGKIIIEIPMWAPTASQVYMSLGPLEISTENHEGGGLFNSLFNSNTGLDFYMVGRIIYEEEDWFIQADVFGGKLRNSVNFILENGTLINSQISAFMPRAYIGLRAINTPMGDLGNFEVALTGGIRYYRIEIDASLPSPMRPRYITSDWFDPIIGTNLSYSIGKFTISTQFDIGLKLITSHPSWWLQSNVSYQIRKRFSVNAGWVRQDIKAQDIILSQDFYINASLRGPMLGLAFKF